MWDNTTSMSTVKLSHSFLLFQLFQLVTTLPTVAKAALSTFSLLLFKKKSSFVLWVTAADWDQSWHWTAHGEPGSIQEVTLIRGNRNWPTPSGRCQIKFWLVFWLDSFGGLRELNRVAPNCSWPVFWAHWHSARGFAIMPQEQQKEHLECDCSSCPGVTAALQPSLHCGSELPPALPPTETQHGHPRNLLGID